jgi:pimeloyl-ACP methyl ester carboxylesterase
VLLAAPFVGRGGWPGTEFTMTREVGARLPNDVPVHVFHGLSDQTAPPDHVELYLRAIPWVQPHLLPGRDHQFNDDLSEVAQVIAARWRG